MYASFNDANPTNTHYTFASENGAEDEVHITHTDPRFCPDGPAVLARRSNVGLHSESSACCQQQFAAFVHVTMCSRP
eukprot:3840566-Prymnesium_polylepis.2